MSHVLKMLFNERYRERTLCAQRIRMKRAARDRAHEAARLRPGSTSSDHVIWLNETWKKEYDDKTAAYLKANPVTPGALTYVTPFTQAHFQLKTDAATYELGLRSDGTIVWRETKP